MCISLCHVKHLKTVSNKDHTINLQSNTLIKTFILVQLETWGKVPVLLSLTIVKIKAESHLASYLLGIYSPYLHELTHIHLEINALCVGKRQPKTHFFLLLT